MSKILIVYGTTYGQTERIVRHVGQMLADAGHTISLHRGDRLPAALALNEFDGFLVAASVLGGRHQRYIRNFVRRSASDLNAAPSAFVSVSGSAASAEPKTRAEAVQYAEQFLRDTGWHPRVTHTFGGAIAYRRYNWILRLVMRRISRRNGGPTDMSRDHELTDWDAVDRFARELAVGVFGTTSSPAGVP